MLNPNDCLESPAFQAVNPLWLRWVREQRNLDSASASVSSLANFEADAGKVARGERTIQPRKVPSGFAIFNDFDAIFEETASASSTSRSVATTLEQPQFLNGVTFANLLERARQRTSAEETTLTTPLTEYLETTTTTPSTTTTTTKRPEVTSEVYSMRASSRYQPRAIAGKNQEFQRLIKTSAKIASPYDRMPIVKRRQNTSSRAARRTTLSTTSTTTTTTTTTTEQPTTTTTTEPEITTIFTTTATTTTTTDSTSVDVPEPETTTDEPETTTLPLAQLILSGQYHESNPGQYYEINPGQYYEVNPGQYNEVNPGQYHEENPGQYIEENSPSVLDDVKVEVKHTEDAKIYNVQSKVDKFIIGEYGTISKESGQTLHGVRYTAVADVSVDPNLIYQTLIKYFPMDNRFLQEDDSNGQT